MSKPTFTAIPASTARGITFVNGAAQRTTTSRIAARIRPERAVVPPAWMFTTVPIVAPAPGIPPNRPDIRLPIPWPISSLLGSLWVRVMLSAIIAVSRASIQPSIPSTKPSTSITRSWSALNMGSCSVGKPVGISPIKRRSALANTVRARIVPATSTSNWGGTQRLNCFGIRNSTARENTPRATSAGSRVRISSGKLVRVPTTPPLGVAWPKNGPSCRIIRITPMPDINPEMTG